MKNGKLVQILKYLLGWPFSILAFFFILRLIVPKIPEFTTNIKSLNATLLISGLISFILFYFIRSFIWHKLVKLYSREISYKKSTYLWASSELKRYIPGNVWGFVGRTLVFSDLGIGKKEVSKLILIEGGIFVIGATLVSLLSLPFLGNSIAPIFHTYQTHIVILILSLTLFYILSTRPMRVFMNFPTQLKMSLVFLSTIAVFFFGLGYYLVISSFVRINPNLVFQLTGFCVLSSLIGVLSFLTPAGFGVREGLMIGGLSKIISVSSSAFAALFGRVGLITAELIFILGSYLMYKTKNKRIQVMEKWISRNKQEAVLVFIFLVYLLYFTLTSNARYDNFYTGTFDLGNMAQTVWNTTQGRIFQFTNPHGTEMISRLAFHADFLLILLAPIYAIIPSPKTLLFIQTLVVALGSFFVYQIAKNKLNDKNLALAFAFSYLLSPSVQRANLYDFHPVTLATTFLLGMYYFYSQKKYLFFIIFSFLAAISKEQIWLIVALFGLLIAIKQKKVLFGLSIFITTAAMFYYLISYAIPNTLGSEHFALSYYSEFGDGPAGIIKSMVFSPQKIMGSIYQEDKIDYLVQLFSHVGYLPVLFPFFIIFASPDLLINLLSSNAQLHQIYYHYTAAITPFIFLSSIFGIYLIQKRINRKLHALLSIFIIFTATLSAYKYGPLPGAREPNLDMYTKPLKDRDFIIRQLSLIPENQSVAASNNIGSHLTNRKFIYTLPLGIDKADVVVFLLNNSEQSRSRDAQKLQLESLKKNKTYEVVVDKEPFVILKKKKL